MDMLRRALSHAYENELGARILSRPTDARVAKIQGFKTVADFKRAG